MNTTFDFDSIIDRRNTNCAKWDTQTKKYGRNDLIHLGVADMDFKSPQPILDELQKVVEHGIFGYTDLNEAFYESIQHWQKKKAGVDVPKEWIVFCPRINISSSICVDSLTDSKANVIINSPAYSPLMDAILKNNRKAIANPLVLKDGRFSMDMNYLESVVNEDTEMFILVNPPYFRFADFGSRNVINSHSSRPLYRRRFLSARRPNDRSNVGSDVMAHRLQPGWRRIIRPSSR